MSGGARVVLVVVDNATLSGHRRVLVKKRAWQDHMDHVHGHGVAQQAPQDQEHDQHERQTSAHGPNDTGVTREVPSTQDSKILDDSSCIREMHGRSLWLRWMDDVTFLHPRRTMMSATSTVVLARTPWNKNKIIGQRTLLKT